MEMNMGKFSEKLVELLELAKKKKNVLEYQEINDFFKDQPLGVEQMEKVFDFLEASGVDVLRITDSNADDMILDDDDADIDKLDEEEIELDKIDLSVPEGVSADQARTIRIPVHMVETINKLIRVSRQLLQELGREPTPEEIAKEMDMSVERVREILKISQEPVSLETPIGEEEDSHLGDFIQDDNVPVPADAAAFTLLKEQLVEVLSTLTDREQKVLRLRFGLDDGRARTLEEVGKEFNVTRERIRQIEAKALRKLRHPSRSRKLKDYLD